MNNKPTLDFIRKVFNMPEGFIPLHAPVFSGNEKKYVLDTIDSTFVSSVGSYVNRFEEMMKEVTGASYAIAIVNGTAALNLALVVAGVEHGTEVITQPLTFVATANAIAQLGARPIFVDVDKDTMGLSPTSLSAWFQANTTKDHHGNCINKQTGKRIAACVPMHTFGHPSRIDEIVAVCEQYNVPLVEDAAESLGSFYKKKHTGRFGLMGTFSFNGNKTITCGGGGAIITDNNIVAQKLKHLSTTAKLPHSWEFVHNEVGYNYRMPNLNAAMACAQLEQLETFLKNKRGLAEKYALFFADSSTKFVIEPKDAVSNYWLNTILFPQVEDRDSFLEESNGNGVMTRPAWRLMNKLPMYGSCQAGDLSNALWLEERIVNIPSSVRNLS